MGDSSKTILDKGLCKNNHPILSEIDVKLVRRTNRNSYLRCRHCDEEAKVRRRDRDVITPKRQLSGNRPRYMVLTCSHTPIFAPQLPAAGDWIYCTACEAAVRIVRWGPKVEVFTGTENLGKLDHGNSTGSCSKGHAFTAENTKFKSTPTGRRARICRTCAIRWNKEYREEQRRRRAE